MFGGRRANASNLRFFRRTEPTRGWIACEKIPEKRKKMPPE
jgi:hypothetical protein